MMAQSLKVVAGAA